MLTKSELNTIRKALPKFGYRKISEKLGNSYSEASVQNVLLHPNRYNPIIIDAALEVIEDYKSEINHQKNRIKEVISHG